MIIFILLFLALPLQAAQHSYVKVLNARAKLVRTYQAKQSQEAIQKAATDMLSELADSKEDEVHMSDILFCLAHKPNVNAVDDDGFSPLMRAEEGNMKLVRELVKAGADVNYATETSFGDGTTALVLAWSCDRVHNMPMLLALGATIGHELNGTTIDVSMWREPVVIDHRKRMIAVVDETRILPTALSPIIINYAFGKPPKYDPETGEGFGIQEDKE